MIQVSSAKPAQQQPGAGTGQEQIAKGENLTGIAQKYYGKASLYTRILEASRDQLSDPDKVREGTVLRIPAA